MAADDPWGEHGLLGANDLLPLLELAGQHLHLLLLLLLLSQQLLALPAAGRHPLLRRVQVEGEKFLAVEEPLHGELGEPQELDKSRVHGALAALTALPVQAAEGDAADVLLEGVHVELAHHQVYVHCVDPTPVHALPARAEFEREDGGGSAGWSHAGCRYRVLAERGIEEGWDPC